MAEAEQASLGLVLEMDSYIVDYERRFEEVGETRAGRILKLVSVFRHERVRILTAFDAPPSLKTLYMKRKVAL